MRGAGLRPLGRQEGHVCEEEAGRPGGRRGLRAEAAEKANSQREGPARQAGAPEPWTRAGRGHGAFAAGSRPGASRCGQLSLQAQKVGDGKSPGARAGGRASGHQCPAPGTPVGKRVSTGHGFLGSEAGPSLGNLCGGGAALRTIYTVGRQEGSNQRGADASRLGPREMGRHQFPSLRSPPSQLRSPQSCPSPLSFPVVPLPTPTPIPILGGRKIGSRQLCS